MNDAVAEECLRTGSLDANLWRLEDAWENCKDGTHFLCFFDGVLFSSALSNCHSLRQV